MLPLLLLGLVAASPATPPAPARWVTDEAGLMSAPARAALDQRLEAVERATGHQVVVWIGGTSGGEPIEQFAERAFRAWRVGRAGLDDGVALFVFANDRTVRLEVGYGLEPVLPDAVCSRIIREQMAPLLASGRADEAITRGVDGVLAAIAAPLPGAGSPAPLAPVHLTGPQWVAVGVAALALLVLVAVRPDLALRLLTLLFLFGRGSRRGGGGFSGRGGRSGGGGATGGW